MKPWIKRTLIGVAATTALLGGFAAFSHGHAYRHGWYAMSEEDAAKLKTRMLERVGSRLALDEAQKAKLGTLADRLREQRQALLGDGADPRAELKALIAGPTFDRNKAQVLVQAKTQAVQVKGPEVIAALADFYDSLKPEQQVQVRGFLERGHGRGDRARD